MGFLAGATKRIRFATSVMIAPYRNPIITAKMLSSLDVLSNGRVIVGLGVGWMKEEFESLQAPPFEDRARSPTSISKPLENFGQATSIFQWQVL